MKYIKQINNLKIYFDRSYGHVVMTLGKSKLKDRATLKEAEEFCKQNDRYIAKGKGN